LRIGRLNGRDVRIGSLLSAACERRTCVWILVVWISRRNGSPSVVVTVVVVVVVVVTMAAAIATAIAVAVVLVGLGR
jgi:hypothetical protein